ncbi:MAG: CrcB family protein [Mycobacteriales bacterium]
MPATPVPPIDPDYDAHDPRQRDELHAGGWRLLAAISAGGVIGSLARYGIATAFPHPADGIALATLAINVSGCLLIGILMVFVTDLWPLARWLRPLLGVGVLGGYTTFSTYVVDIQQAVAAGAAGMALGYLAATLIGALTAVWLGTALGRRIVGAIRPAGALSGVAEDEAR